MDNFMFYIFKHNEKTESVSNEINAIKNYLLLFNISRSSFYCYLFFKSTITATGFQKLPYVSGSNVLICLIIELSKYNSQWSYTGHLALKHDEPQWHKQWCCEGWGIGGRAELEDIYVFIGLVSELEVMPCRFSRSVMS